MASHEAPTLRQAVRYFARLVQLIRPYWTPLIKSMLVALVTAVLGIAPPYFTKLLIDEVYATDDVSLMHVLVAGILAFSLAGAGLGALGAFFHTFVNVRLSAATRLLFFNHLQHLRLRFFEQHRVGEVTSRFQDVRQALDAIARVLETVVVQGAYLVLVPPILFALQWRLALVAVISLPLTVAVTALSGRILRNAWKRASETEADFCAYQVEVLSHIHTFKAMSLEHGVFRRARRLVDQTVREQLRAAGFSNLLGGVTGALRVLNLALFTWYGWSLILAQQMSLGDYLAFTLYIGFLYSPLYRVVSLFSEFQQSAVHLGRMFEYLDIAAEQDPHRVYLPPPAIERRLAGDFRLEGVSFGYGAGQPVLNDLDLRLPAGRVTAVVGPSGSGKTTLLRLLTRLERPDRGIVRIDGLHLAQVPLDDLRRQVAVVWQDAGLVSGSLWDNLTLGAPQAGRRSIDRIVELCGLRAVLADLADGYRTPVAEWGSSLSAGQRQRVALARALARDTPVLLLDEATANIDLETEQQILARMLAALAGRTVIFVTHRLATAAQAHQVRVLEGGRLVGAGPHHTLLERCVPYQRMVGAAGGGRLRIVDEPLIQPARRPLR